ncbi:MAG: DNA primase [Prosthecobacter sp.]|jgi:DNA primase|uniref:DNA primase n=1 Tax=Prosthecobacter sp. TaxID=1965333 RepID=UPI001A033FD7|nr:DNA primase [Prosthecobacter sp.]MBE2284644.1 DNA primase [Prosthecobacter sp.]
MPRIPEETIQQVLAATDIVALVGRSVKLRKAGTNYLGLCPFHNERTPSFNVSPSRGTYHCFGCGAGGSAIRFVMEHDGMSFIEAVKRLADAAGIRVEEEVWDANAEAEAKQRSLLLRANREAAEWFHLLLMKHKLAAPARDYLKSRGINAEMAKRWQMGYAPQSTTFYREWMAQKKLPERVMVDAGIFVQPVEDDHGQIGRAYARWRHRLMFPIRNDNGDVIAFSGRILDKDQKGGKYVNSPETPVFTKSRVLFGFDRSKRFISKADQAIICEGQIDMIMVFEAGLQNVVAGQGTAFTELHAKMLKRVCNEVVLCYDSDNAGREATEKAFRILSPQGINVRVAALPQGEDPDSLIRKDGPDALRTIVSDAPEFLEHQIRLLRGSAKGNSMVERVRMAEQVASAISIFTGVAQRVAAVNKVAKLLEITEEQLNGMVKKAAAEQKADAKKPEGKNGTANVADEARKLLASQHKTAVLLCQMALNDAEVLHWLREADCEDMLREVPGTELLALLARSRYNPLDDTSQLVFMTGLERHEEAAFAKLQAQPRPPGGLDDAKQALYTLEIARLQNLIQSTQAKLRQAGLSEAEMERLQQQVVELTAQRKEYLDRMKGNPNSPPP